MGKKDLILFISIFCVLALISGSTFAYWGWQSDTNKTVVFNTMISTDIEKYIIYDAGEARFVGNFQPSSSHCGGKSNTLSFSRTSDLPSDTFTATIKMDINSIQSAISNSQYVKWAVTSGASSSCGSSTLASGNFYGKSNGNVITLLADQEITTSKKTFTVWLWIDSAGGSSNNSLSGATIDVNIWTQIDMTSTD